MAGLNRRVEFKKHQAGISSIIVLLYNNQINARALIGQSAMVYCAGKPMENRASSQLLYKSNRPQVSMVYRLINHLGCW